MNQKLFATILIVACISLALWTLVQGAEPPKSTLDLLAERKTVQEEIDGLKKDFETKQKAFNKLPAVVEYNANVKRLQERYTEAEKKLTELNGKIADQVAKEKAGAKE